ncbi:hypothetical protein [Streptococcus mitis]|jgi:hypothetical protein|uniref:hypothetical protein n=1 Tax=Streptococcus mitis TaxID=28037 RepID=UPI0021B52C64|nr:hypothetical protein [Streptococcus mitis]MDK7102498.1 hypothetical protein [Streptococcus mitis]
MTLDFTNKSHVDLYNQLCREAKQNLESTKNQIREYFTSDRVDELELYKEKIHVARLRSEQMDSSLNNILSSVFTPTVATTLTLAITIPFELSEKDPNVINLTLYISGAIVILHMLRLVWIRRLNSKSEKEWTNMNRILYFLENYKP